MLDPKGRFPKGRDDTYGLDLLDIAQWATITEHADRPAIREVGIRDLYTIIITSGMCMRTIDDCPIGTRHPALLNALAV